MDKKIKVSLPLAHGEVQASHDIISNLTKNNDVKGLRQSSAYLLKKSRQAFEKSQKTNNQELGRDSDILKHLGNLALEVIPDVLKRKQADNY